MNAHPITKRILTYLIIGCLLCVLLCGAVLSESEPVHEHTADCTHTVNDPTDDTDSTPPDETPPGDTPPDETLPGDTPPGDTPPGDTPPGDTPPGDTPPGDNPSGSGDSSGGSTTSAPPAPEVGAVISLPGGTTGVLDDGTPIDIPEGTQGVVSTLPDGSTGVVVTLEDGRTTIVPLPPPPVPADDSQTPGDAGDPDDPALDDESGTDTPGETPDDIPDEPDETESEPDNLFDAPPADPPISEPDDLFNSPEGADLLAMMPMAAELLVPAAIQEHVHDWSMGWQSDDEHTCWLNKCGYTEPHDIRTNATHHWCATPTCQYRNAHENRKSLPDVKPTTCVKGTGSGWSWGRFECFCGVVMQGTATISWLPCERGKWYPLIPPTCTTDGREEERCYLKKADKSEYHAFKTRKVDRLGHNYKKTDAVPAATCSDGANYGYTIGTSAYWQCTRCDVYKDGIGPKDDWQPCSGVLETATPPTCTEPGKKELRCYKSIPPGKPGHGTIYHVLGTEEILPLQHNFKDTEAKPATTCSDGANYGYTIGMSAYSQCTRCNVYKNGVAPESDWLPCNFDWHPNPAATCHTPGMEELRCYESVPASDSRRNTVYHASGATQVLEATGVFEALPAPEAIAATCENAGQGGGLVCSECGISLNGGHTPIPAVGHDYLLTYTLPPTFTAPGYNEFTCQNHANQRNFCENPTYQVALAQLVAPAPGPDPGPGPGPEAGPATGVLGATTRGDLVTDRGFVFQECEFEVNVEDGQTIARVSAAPADNGNIELRYLLLTPAFLQELRELDVDTVLFELGNARVRMSLGELLAIDTGGSTVIIMIDPEGTTQRAAQPGYVTGAFLRDGNTLLDIPGTAPTLTLQNIN